MNLAPISAACEIIMGQAPAGDTYNTDGIGLPLIAGASDFGNLTPFPSRFTSNPSKKSKAGDIILCIRATIGDLNWSDKEYCLGRGVAGLRVRPSKADARYIWRAVEAASDRLSALGRGATFKQVSRADIADLEIPLPPLEQQKRIAAILDQADELRRLRQRAVVLLDEFEQALFSEMFGIGFGEKEFADSSAPVSRSPGYDSDIWHSAGRSGVSRWRPIYTHWRHHQRPN